MGGLVIFIVASLSLIIAKFFYWETMSLWWLLLPSCFVIGGILFLLIFEMLKESRSTVSKK